MVRKGKNRPKTYGGNLTRNYRGKRYTLVNKLAVTKTQANKMIRDLKKRGYMAHKTKTTTVFYYHKKDPYSEKYWVWKRK